MQNRLQYFVSTIYRSHAILIPIIGYVLQTCAEPVKGPNICINRYTKRPECCTGYAEIKGTCIPFFKCPKQCQNGGVCVDNKCHCRKGFRGDNCSEQCSPRHDCLQHGHCARSNKSCYCTLGYSLADCLKHICAAYELTAVCGIGASACKSDSVAPYICECKIGYEFNSTSNRCQALKSCEDPRNDNSLYGSCSHGVCMYNGNSSLCHCHTRYRSSPDGLYCIRNKCDTHCVRDMVCRIVGGMYTCARCPEGQVLTDDKRFCYEEPKCNLCPGRNAKCIRPLRGNGEEEDAVICDCQPGYFRNDFKCLPIKTKEVCDHRCASKCDNRSTICGACKTSPSTSVVPGYEHKCHCLPGYGLSANQEVCDRPDKGKRTVAVSTPMPSQLMQEIPSTNLCQQDKCVHGYCDRDERGEWYCVCQNGYVHPHFQNRGTCVADRMAADEGVRLCKDQKSGVCGDGYCEDGVGGFQCVCSYGSEISKISGKCESINPCRHCKYGCRPYTKECRCPEYYQAYYDSLCIRSDLARDSLRIQADTLSISQYKVELVLKFILPPSSRRPMLTPRQINVDITKCWRARFTFHREVVIKFSCSYQILPQTLPQFNMYHRSD